MEMVKYTQFFIYIIHTPVHNQLRNFEVYSEMTIFVTAQLIISLTPIGIFFRMIGNSPIFCCFLIIHFDIIGS